MKTKMKMQLIILGSGTFVPELKRHCSSYLIKIGKQNLIFDMGRGTFDQLMKLGIKVSSIDRIFISHTHTDHSIEMAAFLTLILGEPSTEWKKKVIVYGPKGTKKRVGYMLKAHGLNKHKKVGKIKVKDIPNKGIVKGKGWTIQGFSVKHSRHSKSIAYVIKSCKKKIVYAGDHSAQSKNLAEACKNADIAILEATLPKNIRPKSHSSAGESAKIAEKARVKKLILTHIDPNYLKKHNIKKEASRFYKGPVIIAKDLMKIKL